MSPKDTAGMANSEDPDQTAPQGLHCLPKTTCLKTEEDHCGTCQIFLKS